MYKSYQLSIITNDAIITTPHYGVDDEIAGVTADLWERIAAVENTEDLRQAFHSFMQGYNTDASGADSINLFTRPIPDMDEIIFDHEGEWYADFVVIRNLTDRDIDITDLRGKHNSMRLYDGESVILNLGGFYAGSGEDIARRKLLAELDNLKENLWDDNAGKNYSLLWNLCADYDNNQNDRLYLTDIVSEAGFVDEYLLEDYFQNVLAKEPSLARIKCFLGDTHDDDIYKFDGCGNLANVDKDDFIEVIENVQDKITDAIEPEKALNPQIGSDHRHARTGGAEM
jgi:hypothetical protein